MRIRSQEGGGQNNSDRITRIFKYTKAHHGSYLVVPVAARFIVGTLRYAEERADSLVSLLWGI